MIAITKQPRKQIVPTMLLLFASGLASCKQMKERAFGAAPEPATVIPQIASAARPAASAVQYQRQVPDRPLNVLFITIDSLRADMPWTGYPRQIAPNLTKLAEQSIVYENVYSVSSATAKSVGALLSGRYPSTLYRDGQFFTRYGEGNDFMAEALRTRGVWSIGWHSHTYFSGTKGLDQGFDVWKLVPGIEFDGKTDKNVTSDKMTELGIEVLDSVPAGKRFFAWAHYMDPHDTYVAHPESPHFGNQLRDQYDTEVHFTDSWVGKLIDWASQQPWWANTALIISADHGEGFGEHGKFHHAFELWEELVRVPLLVRLPGVSPRRITLRRSQIDLPPTIVELLGLEPIPTFMGKSLVPELYGAPPENREPILLEIPEDVENSQRRAIITAGYKLMSLGYERKLRLYHLDEDPREKNDLASQQPEKLAEIMKVYRHEFRRVPRIQAYGGMPLADGNTARGPIRPPEQTPAQAAQTTEARSQ